MHRLPAPLELLHGTEFVEKDENEQRIKSRAERGGACCPPCGGGGATRWNFGTIVLYFASVFVSSLFFFQDVPFSARKTNICNPLPSPPPPQKTRTSEEKVPKFRARGEIFRRPKMFRVARVTS